MQTDQLATTPPMPGAPAPAPAPRKRPTIRIVVIVAAVLGILALAAPKDSATPISSSAAAPPAVIVPVCVDREAAVAQATTLAGDLKGVGTAADRMDIPGMGAAFAAAEFDANHMGEIFASEPAEAELWSRIAGAYGSAATALQTNGIGGITTALGAMRVAQPLVTEATHDLTNGTVTFC